MILRNGLLAGLLAALTGGPGSPVRAAAETALPAPTWVIAPAAPGEHLPPLGRSLFDELFAVSRHGQSTIELPFPFAALLARLDAQLAPDPASPLPPAKRVLIPLGRSLQRTAAAPEYFAFPRVVVAVDGQPATPSAPYLKDRLYIGYQEKSAVLEVISYNEAAGRFEFQLVKDYRAGGQPQVYYANRNLCFACHQNGAPIFSRALWDETNANPQTASLLASAGRRFYGIPPERGIDIPYAIDNATERANGFALTQRLWRDGCGGADPPARRCRAGLAAAALRHALSGGQRWGPDTAFRREVADRLLAAARRRWPGGLAVGNPDLPNRNPLGNLSAWPVEPAAQIAFAHVAARFDPLLPRSPRETWQPGAPDALATLIGGLAEFISGTDLQALENALTRQTGIATTQRVSLCRTDASPATSRWSIHCAPQAGHSEQAGPTLSGTLSVKAGRPHGGQLSRLGLPGGTALSQIELAGASSVSAEATRFTLRQAGRPPRTAEGHALTRLTFRRSPGDPQVGEVVLEIREEFAALDQAMAALVDSPRGESLFGAGPFPRRDLLSALLAGLGAAGPPPCCPAAQKLPAPRLEVPAAPPGVTANAPLDAGLQAFYPYCATCHQSAETFPPNFLSGSGPQVDARLRQCAPRLYVRLAMADQPPETRAKTPMPPENLLPLFATDAAGWRTSPIRAALLAQVGDWLRAESGHPPRLDDLLAGGYEALRPCLPAP